MSYEDIMKLDLELLASADYLVQLPGWERSIGANRELGFALGTDKIIVSLEQLLTKKVQSTPTDKMSDVMARVDEKEVSRSDALKK